MLNKSLIVDNSKELTGLLAHLYNDNLLDFQTAQTIRHAAQQQNTSVMRYLIHAGIFSSECLLEYCANKFALQMLDLRTIDANIFQNPIIKPELIRRYRVIPLGCDKNTLLLGITDPTNNDAISAIRFHTELSIQTVLISEVQLDEIINLYFRPNIIYSQLETTLSKMLIIEDVAPSQDFKLDYDKNSEEPVIKFVNSLINEAIEKNISDIHIEPQEENTRIRFRRDGILYEAAIIPQPLSIRIAMRLKIMANLNITERRIPQDGRLQFRDDARIDIRINTCPTLHNEKIVLRILDSNKMKLSIESLGFTPTQKEIFYEKIIAPQGLILVTGPTGSGKTMTLYSALHYLNNIEKNICTVEDPVEIELNGINQVNVNAQIGLDFATALRAFLRQDPDIIMVGEIRDKETANIAVQAAQTGHLVLSTLHANNAHEALTRLQSMNIASHDMQSSIILIIAQRLVRKLCPVCKFTEDQVTYRANGCDQCHHGYKHRIGIFEMLSNQSKEITPSLRETGMELVYTGLTSSAEINRVLGT